GTLRRICCLPRYTLSCQFDNRRRRKRLSFRFVPVPAPRADDPPVPTCGSRRDDGGSPSHLERSTLRRHRRPGLFFQGFQFFRGFAISHLIPFALHRVLGALERKAFLPQQTTHMVFTEGDSRLTLQMGSEPRRRPNTKPVAEFLGLGGCTAKRKAARYSAVASEGRPVGLPGRSPARPCRRYR